MGLVALREHLMPERFAYSTTKHNRCANVPLRGNAVQLRFFFKYRTV